MENQNEDGTIKEFLIKMVQYIFNKFRIFKKIKLLCSINNLSLQTKRMGYPICIYWKRWKENFNNRRSSFKNFE